MLNILRFIKEWFLFKNFDLSLIYQKIISKALMSEKELNAFIRKNKKQFYIDMFVSIINFGLPLLLLLGVFLISIYNSEPIPKGVYFIMGLSFYALILCPWTSIQIIKSIKLLESDKIFKAEVLENNFNFNKSLTLGSSLESLVKDINLKVNIEGSIISMTISYEKFKTLHIGPEDNIIELAADVYGRAGRHFLHIKEVRKNILD